jgi:hypothetical protein
MKTVQNVLTEDILTEILLETRVIDLMFPRTLNIQQNSIGFHLNWASFLHATQSTQNSVSKSVNEESPPNNQSIILISMTSQRRRENQATAIIQTIFIFPYLLWN